MRTWIELYFAINIFSGGCYLADKWRFAHRDTVWGCIFWTIIICLFGIPIGVSYVILGLFLLLWDKIDKSGNIKFWLQFYFTTEFNKMEKQALLNINRLMWKLHQSDSKNDKYWRKMIPKVNKRNNYTYDRQADQSYYE